MILKTMTCLDRHIYIYRMHKQVKFENENKKKRKLINCDDADSWFSFDEVHSGIEYADFVKCSCKFEREI